jgi:4-amino-4-deoxy-L-arabinose transferase-like glycosyltransferase
MKHTKLILSLTLGLAVLLRLAAALYLGNTVEVLPGTADQLSYHNLALRLLAGHGFTFGEPWWPVTPANAPTAHWSYLYTFYVTAIYLLVGPHPLAARLIQAVLVGLLQPYLAYWIGKRVFSVPVGLFAAVLTAVYPYFIYYAAALMTEPFYITAILAVLSFAILLRDALQSSTGVMNRQILLYSLALGVALSVTILLRQLFILFIPVIFFWIWMANGWRISWRLVLSASISGILVILAVLPFTVYNYQRFDRFVLLNTNAGFAFYWANHPIYGSRFIPILPPEMGTYLDLIPKELRTLDEATLDQTLLGEGLKLVQQDPRRYVLLSISRIPAFFMFWPSRDSDLISNLARFGGFGLLLPFILYGLVRSFISRSPVQPFTLHSTSNLLLLFILFYTLIHVLSWALVRYRLPVDAVFMIYAGLAFTDLSAWLARKSQTGEKGVESALHKFDVNIP